MSEWISVKDRMPELVNKSRFGDSSEFVLMAVSDDELAGTKTIEQEMQFIDDQWKNGEILTEIWVGYYWDNPDYDDEAPKKWGGPGWYYFDGIWNGTHKVDEFQAVTHWMPLPKIPTVTEEMVRELCEWEDDGEEL